MDFEEEEPENYVEPEPERKQYKSSDPLASYYGIDKLEEFIDSTKIKDKHLEKAAKERELMKKKEEEQREQNWLYTKHQKFEQDEQEAAQRDIWYWLRYCRRWFFYILFGSIAGNFIVFGVKQSEKYAANWYHVAYEYLSENYEHFGINVDPAIETDDKNDDSSDSDEKNDSEDDEAIPKFNEDHGLLF